MNGRREGRRDGWTVGEKDEGTERRKEGRIVGITPAQRAQLLGDLIDEVDLLQVIGR